MTSTGWALLLAGIQFALVILLAADKWVHGVTGSNSIANRLESVEKTTKLNTDAIEKANERLSEKMSEIQSGIGSIQLQQARTEEHLRSTDRDIQNLQRYVGSRLNGV